MIALKIALLGVTYDLPANINGSAWGFSSIFGGTEGRVSMKENSTNMSFSEPVQSIKHAVSMIHLREVCGKGLMSRVQTTQLV